MANKTLLILILGLLFPASVEAATYYVSPNGDDANNGMSQTAPWQTLAKVNGFNFQPGDKILFQKGAVWTGSGGQGTSTLRVTRSGTETQPITFGAYGTGTKPVFSNQPALTNHTRAITIDASWIILENLLTRDTHEAGVYIGSNSVPEHVTVRDIEIANVGIGILAKGTNHLLTNNYIHDLHLVRNTPGGNDDMGAVGIMMNNASNTEVANNRIINAIGPSYDYITDGGIVEWWGNSDNNYVHHNWGENSNGFFEVGGVAGNHALNNTVSNNVALNLGKLGHIHLDSVFGVNASFTVSHNTLVDTQPHNPLVWGVVTFTGSPSPQNFKLLNNIFYVDDIQFLSPADSRGWTYTHENNVYYFADPRTALGFTLGTGEKMADPLFIDRTGKDFHLQTNSPACGQGAFPCDSTPGDFNGDGHVNLFDYNALVTGFGTRYTIFDYNILVANYSR